MKKKMVLTALLALLVLSGHSFAKEANGQMAATGARMPVSVTSDRMEAISNENLVTFRGNVVATEDFTLCSDELLIRYSETHDVKEIEASGNVRIFKDDKTSTSDKAVYDRVERKIILTGRPQVKQCTDTIKGDRITVFLDEDNAIIEGDKGGRVKAVIMPEKKCSQPAQEKATSEEARCKGPR